MKTTLRPINADKLELTLDVTMTLEEWKRLREQLSGHYPAWRLGQAITNLVSRAEQNYNEEVEVGE